MSVRVFVANLDAELELGDPAYVRSSRMAASIRARAASLPPLVALDARDVPGDAVVIGGDAWCMTPSARAVLEALGVEARAPAVEVLRRVNHRSFAASLGPRLPGAAFCASVADCTRAFARAPDRPWLLKRALGFAGRMRKRVVPSAMDAASRTWLAASMDGHGAGLMVEPFVAILAEFSLHGRLLADGTVQRGAPVRFGTDAEGAFANARRAAPGELAPAELRALDDAFDRCASALRAADYFGPFGLDAFRWRDDAGVRLFHPLSELNARYTMAWWVGMGECERGEAS